ncbi:MFS transporter [Arthrobacter sp. NPDC089319]|uniref:MFS transporter n=1 Tax=Arthrobacter sp. NPDC089319 TaxID=3155915 RepID=UPI00342C8DF1
MTDASISTPKVGPAKGGQSRKASMASFFGGALEYYDFALFAAAAAIVFPTVFFGDGAAATVGSLATFGVAYLARPIGAIVTGHIGDRVGRKQALMLTLILMGVSTFLIGCLPTFEQAGMLAPILLVLLRLLQGFSAGGELAGGSSLSVEHAPEGRRGFFSSWTITGIGAGMLLSNLVMIPVAALPDEALYTWGWRIPFWASIAVFAIGYFIRRRLEEPEVFEEIKQEKRTAGVPLFEAFRLNWQGIIRVAFANLFTVLNTVTNVFGIAYAISVGVDRTTMVLVAALAQVLGLIFRPVGGLLTDRFGRKPIFILGVLGSGVMIFAYFASIQAGNVPMIFIVNAIMTGVFLSLSDGVYPAFFAEMFSAKVRYTGMAVGLQVGLLVAGFAPSIGSTLTKGDANNWLPIAIFTCVCSVLAAIAALTAKETFRTPLRDVGITPQIRRQQESQKMRESASV